MGLLATSVLYFTNTAVEANPKSTVWRFLLATVPLLPLAFMEELAFRAYPLATLKAKTGVRPALFITAVLFALYHVASGWSVASSFYGPAVWGLLFGLTAVCSRGIALPTGMHCAANLTTAAFGEADSAVSLWTMKPSLITTAPGRIDWAKLLPVLALLVIAVVCVELYLRHKRAVDNALTKLGLR